MKYEDISRSTRQLLVLSGVITCLDQNERLGAVDQLDEV